MKNKNFKFLSVMLAVLMVFSTCTSAVSALEGDVMATTESASELPTYTWLDGQEVHFNCDDFIYNRGNGLINTFAKLKRGEPINVLYLGGSVTNGTGASNANRTSWRALVGDWLTANAGKGSVNNVNVAYGDACSLFGVYRLNADILPNSPDLIFVEFSINDTYNSGKRGYNTVESTRHFETIVRNIRKTLPDCDIVTILVTDKGMVNPDALHRYAQAHENVSIAYKVPSIHVGRAVAKEMAVTGNPWKTYSGDSAHPNDKGYAIYGGLIKQYLNSQLEANGDNTTVTNHKLPSMISDKLLDGDLQFIDGDKALITASEALGGTGFAYSGGASNLKGCLAGGVKAMSEDCVLAIKFTGTELAILENQSIEGFDISIDGGEYQTVKRDTVRPLILATGLEYGEHTALIKPVRKTATQECHIQGFFTRNQNNATLKENEIADVDCENGIHLYDNDEDLFCNECGKYVSDEPTLVKVDGVWKYFVNGEWDAEATSLHKLNGKWFYIEEGIWSSKLTTLVKYSGKWFYIKNGKWDSSTEDLVKHEGKWFYIKNGKWTTSSKTIFKKNGSWFYINKGKWDSSAKCIFKYNGKDFYISGGKWKSTTNTLFKKDGKYYAIKSGKWYKGKNIIKYNGKKYYVNDGYAQTKYSGKVTISGKKYTVKKGIIK